MQFRHITSDGRVCTYRVWGHVRRKGLYASGMGSHTTNHPIVEANEISSPHSGQVPGLRVISALRIADAYDRDLRPQTFPASVSDFACRSNCIIAASTAVREAFASSGQEGPDL